MHGAEETAGWGGMDLKRAAAAAFTSIGVFGKTKKAGRLATALIEACP